MIRRFGPILLLFLVVGCEASKRSASQNQRHAESSETHVTDVPSNDRGLRSRLIGTTYSKANDLAVFENYSSGGATIGDTIRGETYSISVLQGSEGAAKYVVLEKTIDSDAAEPRFEIVDLLELLGEYAVLLAKSDVDLHIHFCYQNGVNDQEIIAIAEYDAKAEFLTTVHLAWRADREKGKIVEISTEGITIENVGFGL